MDISTVSGEADDFDEFSRAERILRRQCTILIVEDEEMLRMLVEEFLRDEGFPVLTAGNGLEGFQLYREHKDTIRLVLSDVELPGMDGCTAFQHMKKINPGVKAIFVSGYFSNMIKKQLQQLGVRHFLPKPYRLKEMIDAIDQILHMQT